MANFIIYVLAYNFKFIVKLYLSVIVEIFKCNERINIFIIANNIAIFYDLPLFNVIFK